MFEIPGEYSRMPKTTRRRPTRKRKLQRKTRRGRGRGRSRTQQQQRGGQTDASTCKRKGGDWEWVPGAKHVKFGRYFDCDLGAGGGCCRKLKRGEEECLTCWNPVRTDTMKPRGHQHKVCADCYDQFAVGAACPICRKAGFKPWPRPRARAAPVPPAAAAAAAAPAPHARAHADAQDDAWRQAQEADPWAEWERANQEAAGREAGELARMGPDGGGGGSWWPFW